MSLNPPAGVTIVEHPLVQVKLTQLRDVRTGSCEFRARLNELATLMVFEATRTLATRPEPIQTPLAPFEGRALARPVVVAPILRAVSAWSKVCCICCPTSASRISACFGTNKPAARKATISRPPSHLADADVILVDPMLATGFSATGAVSQLKEAGATSIRFVCLVSCPQGVEQLHTAHPDVKSSPPASTPAWMNGPTSCPASATPATGTSGRIDRAGGGGGVGSVEWWSGGVVE